MLLRKQDSGELRLLHQNLLACDDVHAALRLLEALAGKIEDCALLLILRARCLILDVCDARDAVLEDWVVARVQDEGGALGKDFGIEPELAVEGIQGVAGLDASEQGAAIYHLIETGIAA